MTNNTEILSYIKKSFSLQEQGFYKPAIEMLYKALAIDCDNLEILLQLAFLYKLLNNYERSTYYIEKVLELNDKHLDALFLLEEIYLIKKEIPLALEIAEKIYTIEPNPKNLAKKINILNQSENFESIKLLEKSITEKNDEISYELAKAYSTKDLAYSIKLLEEGLAQNKFNNDIALLLAQNYYKNNDLDKSRELFEKLNKNSKSAEILNYLGLFELNDNNYEDAINYFTKACDADDKNPEYLYNLASSFFLKGWLDEALKYFNKAICFAPKDVNYHYAIAYLYYHQNKYDKAISELNFIKNINLSHNLSNILEAMILAKKGDLLSAKSMLEKIIEENTEDDFAYYALSQIFKELAQKDLAKKYIEIALKIKPASLEYLSELADIELSLKNYDSALETANKILSINQRFISGYVYKAKIYLEKEDYDELYEIAQKIIDCDSNSFEGYYYNALALFHQGDKDFAIESLKKAISLNLNNAELYSIMSSFYQELGDFKYAYDWAKEAADIDTQNYKHKWLCARLTSALHKDEEAGKFFSQCYRLASFDKDLCQDYAKYLKSIGKTKQAEKILKS